MSSIQPVPLTDDVIKGAFALFDSDESGKLDAEEVALALNSLGIPSTVADVESHFHTIGATHHITLSEFKILARNRNIANQEAIEAQVFAQFDVSGGGLISARELEAVCRDLGQEVDPLLLQDLVSEVERVHGRFDFQAWKAVLAVRSPALHRRKGYPTPPLQYWTSALLALAIMFPRSPAFSTILQSRQEEGARSRRRGHPKVQPSLSTEPYSIGAPLQFESNSYIMHH